MNLYTIFQCAQLFERFTAFQRTWFPSHKLEQHLAPESINALMAEQGRAVSRLLLSSSAGPETAAS